MSNNLTMETVTTTNRTQELMNYPKISTRVTKLGIAIPTINLPATITCRENAPCRKSCYACKGNFTYKNVKNGLTMNLEAYLDDPKRYFDKIFYTLKMIPYSHFRYHSSGDIVDSTYLDYMCKVARKCKTTKFLCFTKKFELVNEYIANGHRIPNNLRIVFSCWGSFIPDNPYNLPTAHVRFRNGKGDNSYLPEKAHECSGYCGECVNTETSCWKLKKGEAVIFNQH